MVRDEPTPQQLTRIEHTTQEMGRYLFDHLTHRQPRIVERRWWDERLMRWAMHDEAVKVQMFRFIDVLPMLDTPAAVTQHLQDYFQGVSAHLPWPVRLGMQAARPQSVVGRAVAGAARRNALGQARRFIAGTTLEEVLDVARQHRRLKRAFTLDVLGEAVTSEAEANRYLQTYLDLIAGIAPTVNAWSEVPQIDRGHFAELPRVNVSVKLSALDSQFDPIDPEGTTRRVAERLRLLLRAARAQRAHLHVDMESYRTKDLTLRIFQQVLMEEEFRGLSDVGIVIQCYLHDAGADLVKLRDWAIERGTPVWIRLVKGAYWDYETVHAQSQGWPIPVFQKKWESDANFEKQTLFLMRHWQILRPAIASHNLRSLAHALAVAMHLGVPQNGFELQMLYGMADSEKQVLVNLGYRMRIYMPYGELIPGMAYLVRRLLENTSNDSFLRASFTEHVAVEKLLMNPLHFSHAHNGQPNEAAGGKPAATAGAEPGRPAGPFAATFQNEPTADFAMADNRSAMQAALHSVAGQMGRAIPLWVDGHGVSTAATLPSINPSHKSQTVAIVAAATGEHVASAVAAAKRAWPAWWGLGAEARAEFLAAPREPCAGIVLN